MSATDQSTTDQSTTDQSASDQEAPRPAAADAGARVLRLLACDAEDLAVLAAHAQDAAVRVGDLIFLPRENRFALLANRFDWLAAGAGAPQRALAGLHFERVRKVASLGIDRARPDAVLNLLDIAFAAGEAPAGVVTLVFSGGAAIRLEVDYLEAAMADLGPRRPARHAPDHGPDLDEPPHDA